VGRLAAARALTIEEMAADMESFVETVVARVRWIR
jgi:hypothetical protein